MDTTNWTLEFLRNNETVFGTSIQLQDITDDTIFYPFLSSRSEDAAYDNLFDPCFGK